MKAVVAVLVIGMLGFFATAFNPAREMWAPLIVAVVPLLVFMMWPVRDPAANAVAPAQKKKAA